MKIKKKEEMRIEIVEMARKLVGIPYKYGATMEDAPKYFDCSSFTKYLYRQFGYEIPRSTILQATYAGKKVKSLKDIKLGDLLFFTGNSGHYNKKYPQGIGHVALYIGNNNCLHATAKRFKDYPQIVEKGCVKKEGLDSLNKKMVGVVVIKRII